MLRGRVHLGNKKIEELADIYERFLLSRLVIPASRVSQYGQPKGLILSCKAGKHQQRRAGDA